jgi:hypothetical protein
MHFTEKPRNTSIMQFCYCDLCKTFNIDNHNSAEMG